MKYAKQYHRRKRLGMYLNLSLQALQETVLQLEQADKMHSLKKFEKCLLTKPKNVSGE